MNTLLNGPIKKLEGQVIDGLVHYTQDGVLFNALVGKQIELIYAGKTTCVSCGVQDQSLSQDGHCDSCCKIKAVCDLCNVKPELCHYEAGTCREPSWGEENCFTPHSVYLSVTSGVKVGITRTKKLPQRWIDQGATQGVQILSVDKRLTAGLVEQIICSVMKDKTNWRTMLTGESTFDLAAIADEIAPQIEQALSLYGDMVTRTKEAEVTMAYPVEQYPAKVGNALNLEKTPVISGTVLGIKGQYLILDTGVFNWRKYIGYHVELKAE